MGKSPTSWQPGQSGNPKGRPKGSKDALNEAFIKDLAEEWQENGRAALARAQKDKPVEFCRMVASLQPKDQNVNVKDEAGAAHLAALKGLGQDAKLAREIARLKEEIAALKGEDTEQDTARH